MFYKRKIYDELFKHTDSPLTTVLTGMRRTGKTSIVKHLLSNLKNKNSLFIDLERPDNREIFEEKNYEAIKDSFIARGLSAKKKMIIALDEIQLAPNAPSAVKYLSDHHSIKFIITGSSSYYLKNLFSESLAGRKKIFELFPLDFAEFLTFKKIPFARANWQKAKFNSAEYNRLSSYYEEYIRFGGFPQVVLASSQADKRDLLSDIMSSYVNIDIKNLAHFTDEHNLYTLAKLLAGRLGSRIDYSKIARIIGVSRPTIMNYISFFEKTYLIRTVPVFSTNSERQIVKARKIYFCDTGLANSLADLSSGAQFENSIFNQLANLGSLQYFALKSGREIDFIFEGKLAIETKETPSAEDLKKLKRTAHTAGLSKTFLIGRNKSPKFYDFIWGGSIL